MNNESKMRLNPDSGKQRRQAAAASSGGKQRRQAATASSDGKQRRQAATAAARDDSGPALENSLGDKMMVEATTVPHNDCDGGGGGGGGGGT